MPWFLFALVATFLLTLYSLLGRVLSIKSENPRAFAVVYNFISAAMVLLFLLFEPWTLNPIPLFILFLTFIMTIIYGIFNGLEFYARKHVEASTLKIFSGLSPLTTFVASIIFLGEVVSLNKILALILILGASWFVSYKKRGLTINRGLIYALIIYLSLGLGRVVDKKVAGFYPLSFYVFLTYTIPTIYVFLIPPIPIKAIKKELQLASWKIVLLAALSVLGYYSLIRALVLAEASKIILVTSTSSIFTVLAAIIILKEYKNVARKILAGIIATLGILLLR